MTENKGRSILDKLSIVHDLNEEELERKKLEEQRRKLATKFVDLINEMIWKYGPVKIRNYSISYSYSHLEPGTVTLPPIGFIINGLALSAYVEAVFDRNPTPNSHPDSLVRKRFSL